MAGDIYSMLERAYGQGSLGTEDINDQLLHGYRPSALPDWWHEGRFAPPSPHHPGYIENRRAPGSEGEDIAREFGDALREGNVPLAVGAGGALAMGALPGAKLPASKLAAAKAMGFDPKVYYQGRMSPYPGRRPYQFFTEDPEMASMFAKASDPILARAMKQQPSGGHVLPVLLNREGFADLTSKTDLQRIAQALVEQTPHYNRDDGKGIRPLSLEEAHGWLADSSNVRNGRVSFAVPPLIDAIKRAGFNGADVWEGWNKFGLGRPDSSTVVFNPRNIRSVHAAFDPEHAGSGNIMAGIAGPALMAPALASLLSQYAPDTKE